MCKYTHSEYLHTWPQSGIKLWKRPQKINNQSYNTANKSLISKKYIGHTVQGLIHLIPLVGKYTSEKVCTNSYSRCLEIMLR